MSVVAFIGLFFFAAIIITANDKEAEEAQIAFAGKSMHMIGCLQ